MSTTILNSEKIDFKTSGINSEFVQTALDSIGYETRVKAEKIQFEGCGFDYLEGFYENGEFTILLDARKKFSINEVKQQYLREVFRVLSRKFSLRGLVTLSLNESGCTELLFQGSVEEIREFIQEVNKLCGGSIIETMDVGS